VNKVARWLAPAFAALVAVATLAPKDVAFAATEAERQQEIQAEIGRLRDELDEVAADEAEVLADLRVTQRRKAEEEAKLNDLDKKMTDALTDLEVAQSKLDQAIAGELEARRKVDNVKLDLETARSTLKQQAVASFIRFGSGAEKLDVILRANDLGELHDATVFIDSLAERQARIVDQFAALQDDTEELESAAQAARDAASVQRDAVKSQTWALESARAEQAEATSVADAEADHEQSLLESLRGTRADYEHRIREQQQASEEITELLRRRGSGGVVISGRGALSAPVSNPVVTSTFGYRVHPIFGDRRLHTGIDFRASTGTPITAARAGEVVFAGWRGGYGNCTIIDHGGGLATLYAHQSALKVEAGDVVSRGQVIGAAGSTGFATGPHLHFEVRVNGTPTDPMPYL
jgi:murein DD-endopeptidase MepM/ murein hydrolase activator NlpD